jgi:hypothetical protein
MFMLERGRLMLSYEGIVDACLLMRDQLRQPAKEQLWLDYRSACLTSYARKRAE